MAKWKSIEHQHAHLRQFDGLNTINFLFFPFLFIHQTPLVHFHRRSMPKFLMKLKLQSKAIATRIDSIKSQRRTK